MKYIIITGTTSGLGEALATQAIIKGWNLVSLSRRKNLRLMNIAKKYKRNFSHYTINLMKTKSLPKLMKNIINKINQTSQLTRITLINNAGMLDPVAMAQHCPVDQISANIAVNLLAPIILSSSFIRETQNISAHKQLLQISSGTGRKSYKGWSVYSAAKAGLDHFTRILQEENSQNSGNMEILSLAPGKIDTPMQEKIRKSKFEDFPLVEEFKALKNKGALPSPVDVASKILWILENYSFSNSLDPVIDIKDIDWPG